MIPCGADRFCLGLMVRIIDLLINLALLLPIRCFIYNGGTSPAVVAIMRSFILGVTFEMTEGERKRE